MSNLLQLHSEATKNFNEKALNMIPQLKIIKEEKKEYEFKPDFYITHTITEDDIVGNLDEIIINLIDKSGQEVGKYFIQNSKKIGFLNDEYKQFRILCEQIYKTKSYNTRVSIHTISEFFFSWLKEKYNHNTLLPLTLYLEQRCIPLIKNFQIWTPIAYLHVQHDINIGKITLKNMSKELFDDWCSKNEKENSFIKEKQKNLQGLAASTINLLAESRRASEIALEETHKSLMVLNFFSKANFDPNISSYCNILGIEDDQSSTQFLINDSVSLKESSVVMSKKDWVINDEEYGMIEKVLKILSLLLTKQNKNDLEKKILNTVYLYSKSSFAKNISDKLIYIFASLETLLLKNESEPIQNNIAERMAFIVGKDINERKNIIKNVKEVYNMRSRFFHHGYEIDDKDKIEMFMVHTWKLFFMIIENFEAYSSKDELISAIEERKLL